MWICVYVMFKLGSKGLFSLLNKKVSVNTTRHELKKFAINEIDNEH